MTILLKDIGVLLIVVIVILSAGCGSVANEIEGLQGPGDNETNTDTGDGEDNSSTEDENTTDESSEADGTESGNDSVDESNPPDSDDEETESDDAEQDDETDTDTDEETSTEETEQEEGGDTNGGSDDEGDQDSGGGDGNQDDEVSEPGQSSLTLTVVGPAGEPIEGASIAGEGDPHEANIPLEFSGETDTEGQYTSIIYENEYTILVDHPDYDATTVDHTHDGDGEITVELEPEDGPEPGTSLLTLSVVDGDGEPIEGATVTGEGEPHDADVPLTFSGETDANGQYTDVIYENQYSIEVDHPDYDATTVDHNHDGESEVTVELESGNGGGPIVIDSMPEAEGLLQVAGMNVDAGRDTENEWILFENTGNVVLDISGWTVTDRSDGGTGSVYTFNSGVTLDPGEQIRLVTGDGSDTENEVFWGLGAPRWNQDGDIVVVEDANGVSALNHPYGNQASSLQVQLVSG